MYWIPESVETEQKDYLQAKVYFSARLNGRDCYL